MWVNPKQARDCPGNPWKLGMEVFESMANREIPRSGHGDVAPQSGMVVAGI